MNHNIILLIIVVIISSVIFLYNCRTMIYFKENFQNSQDVLNVLERDIDTPSLDTSIVEQEFDSDGNILKKFEEIDTTNMYKDIPKNIQRI